jgi:hypothetical protein
MRPIGDKCFFPCSDCSARCPVAPAGPLVPWPPNDRGPNLPSIGPRRARKARGTRKHHRPDQEIQPFPRIPQLRYHSIVPQFVKCQQTGPLGRIEIQFDAPILSLEDCRMKRREFIAGLGGAAAWPLAARAQQPELPLIGYLDVGSPESAVDRIPRFRKGLSEIGFVEGRNIAIENHWANNDFGRLPYWRPIWSGAGSRSLWRIR